MHSWTTATHHISRHIGLPVEHKFDGKPSSLHIFMKSIANRAKSFGWNNILNIQHANTEKCTVNHGEQKEITQRQAEKPQNQVKLYLLIS